MYKKIENIHLIGIGGIGMSGIAELLVSLGYHVSGSDLGRGESVKRLEAVGVRVVQGHHRDNLRDASVVVYSSAINPDNPEMIAAKEKKLPTIPRAEMLAELMRLKHGIAVAGAHGKTTTTSMIAWILTNAKLDPTIVVGGRMDNFGGTNARLGKGNFMVVEADESDGSFNLLAHCVGVVTNMDREHLDHYGSMENVEKAFLQFMNKIPFYGASIVCADDPILRRLITKCTRRLITYGFAPSSSYEILSYLPTPEGSLTRFRFQGKEALMKLPVPGRHNALNALAALAVSEEIGLSREAVLAALNTYSGVQRRFQKRGERNGVVCIDDYAHHPSEISATLAAVKERYPLGKIRVVFQPHRFSRVNDLFKEFSSCFAQCDHVAVTDIYAAGEKPIDGVSGETLALSISQKCHVGASHVKRPLDVMEEWLSNGVSGDVVVTLGAGDLPNVYQKLF